MITKTHIEAYSRKPRQRSRISYLLRSALPKDIKLMESVHQLVHTVNSQYQLRIELVHCGFESETDLREQDRIAIYLIIKAQVKNILKRSGATSATIHLAKNYNQVAIVIEDNGTSVDITKMKNNRAIRTVQNLVKHHKGRYNVVFEPESGTIVEALLHVEMPG